MIAANLIPYRIFGDPTIDLMDADKFIPPNHCFWARNCLQRGLNGLDKDIKGTPSFGKHNLFCKPFCFKSINYYLI